MRVHPDSSIVRNLICIFWITTSYANYEEDRRQGHQSVADKIGANFIRGALEVPYNVKDGASLQKEVGKEGYRLP